MIAPTYYYFKHRRSFRWIAASSTVTIAIAYYFAREIIQTQDIPVGIIVAAVGNTPGEAWVADSVLKANADFAPGRNHRKREHHCAAEFGTLV